MAENKNPKLYLKLAIGISLIINVLIFALFSCTLYFGYEKAWVFGWKPILIAIAGTLIYTRISYKWMMRTDAQYGTGSGWKLVSTTVKLPERVIRK